MEYRLLCDGDGIILTREPELVHGELYISFKGALIERRLSLSVMTERVRIGLFLTACVLLRAVGSAAR